MGSSCSSYTLTVSIEEEPHDFPTVSDCRYGNSVKLARSDGDGGTFEVIEMGIVGKEGGKIRTKIYLCSYKL